MQGKKQEHTAQPAEGENAAAEPANDRNTAHRAREGAYKKLRKAMENEVNNRCDKIAKSLVDSTENGNSNSARIVVSLVEKKPKKKRRVPKGRLGKTVAMNLLEEIEADAKAEAEAKAKAENAAASSDLPAQNPGS
jgi:hypothetical protein